jgi:hypothetical protein
MTTAGVINLAEVSGLEKYVLANGAINVLTLTLANFAGVSGGAITVYCGDDANAITAANRSLPGSPSTATAAARAGRGRH